MVGLTHFRSSRLVRPRDMTFDISRYRLLRTTSKTFWTFCDFLWSWTRETLIVTRNPSVDIRSWLGQIFTYRISKVCQSLSSKQARRTLHTEHVAMTPTYATLWNTLISNLANFWHLELTDTMQFTFNAHRISNKKLITMHNGEERLTLWRPDTATKHPVPARPG